MRYSNDEERAAAKRAAKKKYYEKNKGKYRMWAMQWRHENQPQLYLQEEPGGELRAEEGGDRAALGAAEVLGPAPSKRKQSS